MCAVLLARRGLITKRRHALTPCDTASLAWIGEREAEAALDLNSGLEKGFTRKNFMNSVEYDGIYPRETLDL